jgi:hypothetical protein
MKNLTFFANSPDAGHPDCLCSLCSQLITLDDVPVRLFRSIDNTEARFHLACFKTAGFQLATPDAHGPPPFPSLIPDHYLPPLGLPLYWRNEVTGKLPDAVNAYLDTRLEENAPSLTSEQLILLKAYFAHYINAPCWDESGFETELKTLRKSVQTLISADDLAVFIHSAQQMGLDPL